MILRNNTKYTYTQITKFVVDYKLNPTQSQLELIITSMFPSISFTLKKISPVNYNDAYQDQVVALISAVNSYTPTNKTTFPVYASWLLKKSLQNFLQSSFIVKSPTPYNRFYSTTPNLNISYQSIDDLPASYEATDNTYTNSNSNALDDLIKQSLLTKIGETLKTYTITDQNLINLKFFTMDYVLNNIQLAKIYECKPESIRNRVAFLIDCLAGKKQYAPPRSDSFINNNWRKNYIHFLDLIALLKTTRFDSFIKNN